MNVARLSEKAYNKKDRKVPVRKLKIYPALMSPIIFSKLSSELYRAMNLVRACVVPNDVNRVKKLGRMRVIVKSPYSDGVSILATMMAPTAFTKKETVLPTNSIKEPLTVVAAVSLIPEFIVVSACKFCIHIAN
jgi:hypothetical protein